MSSSDPPESGRASVTSYVASSLKRKLLASTAAITLLLGFLAAVEGLYQQIEPLTCALGISLPWCKKASLIETWSDEVGGPGGRPFSPLACHDSDVLTGIFGKAGGGPFVYSIGPICASAKFNQKHQLSALSGNAQRGDEIGSSQGSPFELACPPNMAVVGYDLDSSIVGTLFAGQSEFHEYLVTPLKLRCSGIATAGSPTNTIAQAGPRQSNASAKPFVCPNGSTAYAIKGAGQFVDAVSIGCR